ncbi:MAG: 6,7-dimethyl-8-ribityllumazine synthase [Terriglobales bacterium]
MPHALGVLTCETLEQAVQRAGVKGGSKGWEAALVEATLARPEQSGRTLPPSEVRPQPDPQAPPRALAPWGGSIGSAS